MSRNIPIPPMCPQCGNKLFTEIRIGSYGQPSRPALKCAAVDCGLRFDGEEWTQPDGSAFELTAGT